MRQILITFVLLASAAGLLFSMHHDAEAQSGKTVYWFTLEHLSSSAFKTEYIYVRSPEYQSMAACQAARPGILANQLINPGSLIGEDLANSECQSGTYGKEDPANRECETDEETGETKCKKETPYMLLSGLPGLDSVDSTTTFGQYLNIIFKLIIGLTTIGAVVMIIWGGVQYMTTDAFTGKAAGIERMKTALWGLLLALFSWVILFTINPDLLELNFIKDSNKINVVIEGDVFYPEFEYVTNVSGYTMNNVPSAGVAQFASALTLGGYTLKEINVSSTTAEFIAINTVGEEKSVTVPVGIGKNGFSEIGTAKVNDGKTPKGVFMTGQFRTEIASNVNNPVVTETAPPLNLGHAFIGINALDENSQYRGIGFHGFKSGTTGQTNGCISLRNDDLYHLAPFMSKNIRVTIGG